MTGKKATVLVLLEIVIVALGVYVYFTAPDRGSLLIYGFILGVMTSGVGFLALKNEV